MDVEKSGQTITRSSGLHSTVDFTFCLVFPGTQGTVNGEVLDGKCRRSPIANGGLEIMVKVSFCISDLNEDI